MLPLRRTSRSEQRPRYLRLVIFGAVVGWGLTSVASATLAGGDPGATGEDHSPGPSSTEGFVANSLGSDFELREVLRVDDASLSIASVDDDRLTCLVGESEYGPMLNCRPREATAEDLPLTMLWTDEMDDPVYYAGMVERDISTVTIGGERVQLVNGLFFGRAPAGSWVMEFTREDGTRFSIDHSLSEGPEVLNGREVSR